MSLCNRIRYTYYISLDRSDNEESLKMGVDIIERHEYKIYKTDGGIRW